MDNVIWICNRSSQDLSIGEIKIQSGKDQPWLPLQVPGENILRGENVEVIIETKGTKKKVESIDIRCEGNIRWQKARNSRLIGRLRINIYDKES